MTEPAQNYQTIQSTSIEGLDQIFDVVAEGLDVAGLGPAEGQQVTLVEAAKILNIARRSALRLIHEGKLDGAKDDHGQWLVKTASLNKRISAKNQTESVIEEVAVQVDDVHGQGWTETQANGHDELLRDVLAKLEALTYRNGYLESQLSERQREIEERDQQIKLLTDSQHKPGKWARFRKWFLGQ